MGEENLSDYLKTWLQSASLFTKLPQGMEEEGGGAGAEARGWRMRRRMKRRRKQSAVEREWEREEPEEGFVCVVLMRSHRSLWLCMASSYCRRYVFAFGLSAFVMFKNCPAPGIELASCLLEACPLAFVGLGSPLKSCNYHRCRHVVGCYAIESSSLL